MSERDSEDIGEFVAIRSESTDSQTSADNGYDISGHIKVHKVFSSVS